MRHFLLPRHLYLSAQMYYHNYLNKTDQTGFLQLRIVYFRILPIDMFRNHEETMFLYPMFFQNH